MHSSCRIVEDAYPGASIPFMILIGTFGPACATFFQNNAGARDKTLLMVLLTLNFHPVILIP